MEKITPHNLEAEQSVFVSSTVASGTGVFGGTTGLFAKPTDRIRQLLKQDK